ncbi:MAG: folate hydrolase, partial [Pyrinomonadaceae bacterium]|nr:folate hydrolase [Pyrinomonadaceae bacterium]
LAEAETLQFEFTNFAETVARYVDEVEKLTKTMREETKAMNGAISSGILKAVQDPRKTYVVPEPKDEVPFLNFAPLQNALVKLETAAKQYDKARKSPKTAPNPALLSDVLYKTERALTSENGLPGRNWFRHQIYAPGFYTGYGVKTLPSVREAIEQRDWKLATEKIKFVAEIIEGFAEEIENASEMKSR